MNKEMNLSENFTRSELACRCCDRTAVDAGVMSAEEFQRFLSQLEALRNEWKRPIFITSGYRCKDHNRKVGGSGSSRHLVGDSVDIRVSGADALRLASIAIARGWNGIGLNQKGPVSSRFLHIDRRTEPAFWTY
jgi:uncharacterized protein YcbK (DUF882 family)